MNRRDTDGSRAWMAAVVALHALLGGCHGVHAPKSGVTGAAPARARAGGDVDPLRVYARAHGTEVEKRLSPPLNLFLAHEQKKPAGFAPFFDKSELSRQVHHARMFAFGYGGGCADRVVQGDGTICDAAVYPGVALTGPQAARVAELYRSAATPASAVPEVSWNKRAQIRCFDPHHAVVFFDEQSRPIAEMTVCFECGNFRLAPGPGGEAAMTDVEGTFLADTCRALDVGGCPPAGTFRMPDLQALREDTSTASLTVVEREDLRRLTQLARPYGVNDDLQLVDLTTVDRKLLCAWFDGARMRFGGRYGYECVDGRGFVVEEPDGCVKPVSKACTATVRDFVACTRSRLGKLCGADAPECARTDACKKGVVRR